MKQESTSSRDLVQELEKARKKIAELKKSAVKHKGIQQKLFETNKRLYALMNALPVGIAFTYNTTSQNLIGNPALYRMFGIRPEENISASAPDTNAPGRQVHYFLEGRELRDSELPLQRAVAENQEIPVVELEIESPSGRRWFSHVSGAPIRDDHGKVIGGIAVIVDITRNKKAEEELREIQDHLQELVKERTVELEEANTALKESEAKYRFLTEKMSDVIWTADVNLNLTYVSPSIEKILGYTPGERIQILSSEALSPESYARTLETFNREVERNRREGVDPERSISMEFEFYHKNGSIVWTDNIIKGIYDSSGNLIGVHGVGRDITNRKKIEKEKKHLEEQLMQMQKIEALDRFAGGIAHDLNNILYPIIINTEQLLLEAPMDSGQHEILNQILRAAYRQRDLIKQILAFTRKHDTEFIPTKVVPLLEESIDFLRSSIPSTIEIHYHTNAETDMILGDPTKIEQVILNLCQNAADAMESQVGTIEISLSNTRLESVTGYPDIQPGEYLRLAVQDTGSGMNPDVMNKIFDPFFTTKGVGKGTGVGLSVVYGIVKSHKGAIIVNSKEGIGSLFTIYLPICDEECQARACFADSIASVQGKEKILLVDDEEMILSSLQQALKTAGYRVIALRNSREALTLFEKRPHEFDLVINDLTMPGMTGVELSRKILDIRSDIPVILCTGFNDIIDSDKAKSIGIRELLQKPAGIKELKDVIRRALEK